MSLKYWNQGVTGRLFKFDNFIKMFSKSLYGMSDLYSKIESCIFIDPGHRGIDKMWTPGCLSDLSSRIFEADRKKPSYILTGFCCKGPASETDGPLGSAVLAEMLRFVGFDTFLLTDKPASSAVIAAATNCPVIVTNDPKTIRDISFIISIERPGKSAKTGTYRTMIARDISDVTAPLDDLFPIVGTSDVKPYLTIGVGDGGNEVGTGNIADLVRRDVPKGEEICVSSGCDVLVMAGVSNWGAIGIAAAIALRSGNRGAVEYCIELINSQKDRLAAMVAAGSYDGCTGKFEASVDGMMYDQEHTNVANGIIEVLKMSL